MNQTASGLNTILRYSTSVLLFILSFFFFRYLLNTGIETDILHHARTILAINEKQAVYSPGFLYFLTVNSISGFSHDLETIGLASAFLIAVSVAAKFLITEKIIREYLLMHALSVGHKLESGIIVLALSLMFVFALPDFNLIIAHKFCLGKIPPNVWHSGTLLFLFPFALLLFWKQFRFLSGKENPGILLLTLLVVINVCIKPSFFFVYALITPYFLYKKLRFSKDFLIHCIPVATGLVCILIEYVLIYTLNIGSSTEASSGLTITSPFEVWRHFIHPSAIPQAVFASFTLPLVYFFLHRKSLLHLNLLEKYVLLMLACGLLMYIFIAETGPRKFHGNFAWQNIIIAFLLMLSVSMESLMIYVKGGNKRWKEILILAVFVLHLLSGIAYLFTILLTGDYC